MDHRAVAVYYVLYRLTQQGFAASPTTGGQAELMACTVDGRRVVLLRVRARDGSRWSMTALDRRPPGRNVAYAFVDLGAGDTEPSVFVLRGALVASLLEADPDWPRGERAFLGLDDCRDAWHRSGFLAAFRFGPKAPSRRAPLRDARRTGTYRAAPRVPFFARRARNAPPCGYSSPIACPRTRSMRCGVSASRSNTSRESTVLSLPPGSTG